MQAGSYPSFITDVALRLQQLVAGWQGAERNQPLTALHSECLNAAEPGGHHLLPAKLLLIEDLDETHLQVALHRHNGKWQSRQVRFHFKVAGRFDAALVPIGLAGELPERWLLTIEAHLPISEQVALYGHGLGHLLLNHEQVKMDRLPALDPRDGYAHRDMLAELRILEATRQPLDLRVLETSPSLTALLGVRDEPPAVLDLVASDLRRRLAQWGGAVSTSKLPTSFRGAWFDRYAGAGGSPLSLPTEQPQAALLPGGRHQSRGNCRVAGETRPTQAPYLADAGDRDGQDENRFPAGREAEAGAGDPQCALPEG